MRRTLSIALAMTFLASATLAQQKPTLLGQHKDWDAFTLREGGKLVCYIASDPAEWSSQPRGANRGAISLLVTHRPASNVRDEVSVHMGYRLKENSEVIAEVDGQKFTLFTKDEGAWAADPKTDKALSDAMARGNTLLVKGTSVRGTATTDRYSLAGYAAAREAANKACNIR
ncbi:MAG: hypothetical protein FJX65_03610 [Alphaproteobacteria bacterium]|nr:hypothetical protein [Alphaproteobacteria bacterium]